MSEEKEILALLKTEISRAMASANSAVELESKDKFARAVVYYARAIQILYVALCFVAGTPLEFSKTATKSSAKVSIARGLFIEKISNAITRLFVRIQSIENLLSSGNAETYSLMRSIDIPLNISQSDEFESVNEAVKEVLVRVELDPDVDAFDNIIGHDITKENLKRVSATFALNVNENTKSILQNRRVSSNMMIILYGPPGTGKTSLVKALANHLNVDLYELKLSALYNKYVGETEKTMSAIFKWILSSTEPKIVFIDELDSLFSKRGGGNEDSLDKKLKNIFMVEMNHFIADSRANTLIAGATNLIDDIDEAITRRSLLNIEVGKPQDVNEYRSLIFYEFSKLKMNFESGLCELIADEANRKKMSQSKIGDIAKKLFLLTARLADEFYVRKFKDAGQYRSLDGAILGADDEKYAIINAPGAGYETNDDDVEKVRLDSERGAQLARYVVLPIVTKEFFIQNKDALM